MKKLGLAADQRPRLPAWLGPKAQLPLFMIIKMIIIVTVF